ncbi:hypothetical protein P3X46_003068 [Hevea brasiliensis]|uniref:SB domain-containing protein n=1 Tax=Hevea brasiliensis TaxID=3981 RepID=A0ABQ9N529_HEVBR|nr:hypothetical protein P3X46_003068 [Hevea brasiliensis]
MEALDRLSGMLHYDMMAFLAKNEEEVENLSKLQEELIKRDTIIRNMISSLEQERSSLKDNVTKLTDEADVVMNWLRVNDANSVAVGGDEMEEAFEAADEESKLKIECLSGDRAIEDLIYALDKAVEEGTVPFDAYIKQVRALAREQFYSRAMLVELAKGIWVWGTPVKLDINGVKTSVFYIDTEGFESVGKSNVYDDRIFALATVLSSVLIYNLPEMLFYGLADNYMENRVKGQDFAFEPVKLLWLVQRDFLQGKSVQEMLNEALQRVPNNDALHEGEIPSTGSLVEVFNKGILEQCLKLYSETMVKLSFPLPEQSLQDAHERSRGEAMKSFDEQHFGRNHAKRSFMQLEEEIDKPYKNVILANDYQSAKLCEALYVRCEDKMDQLQVLRLPSMAKFNADLLQCNQSFEQECVGPSKANYEQHMMKMLGKSKSLFIKEYNQRLFNWLVAFSLVLVVVGRFIIKFILMEMGTWILFIFLETYTRMFWSAESLYYNPVWHFIVATWETLVYIPILDLDRWAVPIGFVVSILVIYWRCYGKRKQVSRWLLPLYNNPKDGPNRPRSDRMISLLYAFNIRHAFV